MSASKLHRAWMGVLPWPRVSLKWITGAMARQDVQHWRAISGAVITGIETVLADDCLLNVRQLDDTVDMRNVVQPKRIVLRSPRPLAIKRKNIAAT